MSDIIFVLILIVLVPLSFYIGWMIGVVIDEIHKKEK